jgi:hypothetical protein
MPQRAWHRRRYEYWLSNGGQKPAYKENLCHYVRVILFKVTWMKFIRRRLYSTIPLWVAPVAALAVVIIAAPFYLWPSGAWVALKWIGFVAAVLAVVIGLICAYAYLYEKSPERTKRIGKWITSPIWIGPFLIIRALKWSAAKVGPAVDRFIGWFVYDVYPLAITVGVPAVYSIYRWPHVWLRGLSIVGIGALLILGAITALIVIFGVASLVKKAWRESIKETLSLSATYLDTKKKGSLICPFIEFEEAETA